MKQSFYIQVSVDLKKRHKYLQLLQQYYICSKDILGTTFAASLQVTFD